MLKANTVNFVLIQNVKILVIFQYLQAKYCNGSEIVECCFTLRRQLKSTWMLSSSKKVSTFSLQQFYDAAKEAIKSLLKLTEHSELNTKTALKTWSLKLT